jgi:hypothetical protein
MVDESQSERRASSTEFAQKFEDFTAGFNRLYETNARVDQARAEKVSETLTVIKESQVAMKAEYGQRFDNIDKTHTDIASTMKQIAETMNKNLLQTAVHEDRIETLKKQSKEHYVANSIQDATLETLGAIKAGRHSPASPPQSFLMSTNGRIFLIACTFIVIGFFGVLGVQVITPAIAEIIH